jgi:hypothetical protein
LGIAKSESLHRGEPEGGAEKSKAKGKMGKFLDYAFLPDSPCFCGETSYPQFITNL